MHTDSFGFFVLTTAPAYILLPTEWVDWYYEGITIFDVDDGYLRFACSAVLKDLSVVINGATFTVPGSHSFVCGTCPAYWRQYTRPFAWTAVPDSVRGSLQHVTVQGRNREKSYSSTVRLLGRTGTLCRRVEDFDTQPLAPHNVHDLCTHDTCEKNREKTWRRHVFLGHPYDDRC